MYIAMNVEIKLQFLLLIIYFGTAMYSSWGRMSFFVLKSDCLEATQATQKLNSSLFLRRVTSEFADVATQHNATRLRH